MRVAIDVTPLIAGSTGVARYTRELCRALDGSVDLRPFAVGRPTAGPAPAGTRHLRVPLRIMQRWWRVSPWPRVEHLVGAADVVHSLDLVPPPTRLPVVTTVHDLAALDHPDLHAPAAADRQRRQLDAAARAAIVIADSHCTRDVLVRHGVDAARIVVAPLGVTLLPPPRDPGLGLVRFLLAIGGLHPRKGIGVLLEALAATPSITLVHAGPDQGAAASLSSAVDRLGLRDRVRFLGPVDDAVLSWLYRHATALAFPSLAEGFGLPLVEALAAGLPVVATDLDVVREVCADAAILVPPGDPAALAEGLAALLGDATRRADLAGRALERSRQFDWTETARATVRAYELAVACA